MKLTDCITLITGGNRGIGLATARLFAAEGARVVILARDLEQGEAQAATIPGASALQCDVTRATDCERAVAQTLALHGGLDVLVNNAGVLFRGRRVDQTTDEEWDTTFDVNVKGVFLMSRAALAALRERRGAIVNVASYAGLVGYPNNAAYGAAKAAVVNLTRCMALDHAREGVRVNAVCPGAVETDMLRSAWKDGGDSQALLRAFAEKHPIGRIASADEVARAIAFLGSGDAAFITGVALPVDGGITAG